MRRRPRRCLRDSCNTNTAGVLWAEVRDANYLYVKNSGWDWQVKIWAGDDIETQGSGWDPPTPTRAFVAGYNSQEAEADPGEFLDYGAWFPGYSWTTSDILYVAWTATLDWPFPEIYTQYFADSWTSLATGYGVQFRGAMGTTSPYWAGPTAFSKLDADLMAHNVESDLVMCSPISTNCCDTTIAYQ